MFFRIIIDYLNLQHQHDHHDHRNGNGRSYNRDRTHQPVLFQHLKCLFDVLFKHIC